MTTVWLKRRDNAITVFLILLSLLLLFPSLGKSQTPPLPVQMDAEPFNQLSFFHNASIPNKCRTKTILYSTLGLYPVSMYWLYTQWYQDYPQGKFHFFNDNKEWEQMDKFAHVWDAYSISKPLMRTFQWAGYDNRKSTLYACGISFLYQTTIELFDGFSKQWGFSGGDMVSNALGEMLLASQQLIWKDQRITLKYSFHETKYAQYRPDLLGSNLPERILKDYNGLTYWVSANPRSFFPADSGFPKWISLAVGFGAEGMTGAETNPGQVDGKVIPKFERYRQYYFGIDFDLARITCRSQFLNAIFKAINIVHLPAPVLEIKSGHGTKFHWLYF